MDILVDDCLITIFEYLPIVDKIRLQRVCKRWFLLSKLSWTTFKKLDISVKTWKTVTRKNARKTLQIDNEIINKVIELSGKYLTTIDIGWKKEEGITYDAGLDLKTFQKICTNCPNIREFSPLNICELSNCNSRQKCSNHNHKIIPWLMLRCETIKKLGFNMMSICDSEDEIGLLFNYTKNLKSICIQAYWTFGQDFLLKLPFETLEELIFIDVNFCRKTAINLNTIMSKARNLHTVVFQRFENRYDDSIIRSLLLHTNLRNLKIDDCEVNDKYGFFPKYISLSNQLEVLELKWCRFVDDSLLGLISETCLKLKKLNITGCRKVTDLGIRRVSALKELRCLIINNSICSDCLPINEFMYLKELSIAYCYYLKSSSVFAFVRQAPNLQFLNVRCSKILVNKLVITAIEAVNKRRNNKKLTLKLEVEAIDIFLYKEIRSTPLLEICDFNRDKRSERIPVWEKLSERIEAFNVSTCRIH